nr:PKD domain-containing protein [uncultured Desulfobulbus sp.]
MLNFTNKWNKVIGYILLIQFLLCTIAHSQDAKIILNNKTYTISAPESIFTSQSKVFPIAESGEYGVSLATDQITLFNENGDELSWCDAKPILSEIITCKYGITSPMDMGVKKILNTEDGEVLFYPEGLSEYFLESNLDELDERVAVYTAILLDAVTDIETYLLIDTKGITLTDILIDTGGVVFGDASSILSTFAAIHYTAAVWDSTYSPLTNETLDQVYESLGYTDRAKLLSRLGLIADIAKLTLDVAESFSDATKKQVFYEAAVAQILVQQRLAALLDFIECSETHLDPAVTAAANNVYEMLTDNPEAIINALKEAINTAVIGGAVLGIKELSTCAVQAVMKSSPYWSKLVGAGVSAVVSGAYEYWDFSKKTKHLVAIINLHQDLYDMIDEVFTAGVGDAPALTSNPRITSFKEMIYLSDYFAYASYKYAYSVFVEDATLSQKIAWLTGCLIESFTPIGDEVTYKDYKDYLLKNVWSFESIIFRNHIMRLNENVVVDMVEKIYTIPCERVNSPPEGYIASPESGTSVSRGSYVTFSATGNDPEKDQISYSWNFSDGGSAEGGAVSHQFNIVGVNTVTLTASDNSGQDLSPDSITINVLPIEGEGHDLAVTGLNISSGNPDPGDSITVYYTISNQGEYTETPKVIITLTKLGGSSTQMASITHASLASGASSTYSKSCTIPSSSLSEGKYELTVSVSGTSGDEDWSDNSSGTTLQVGGYPLHYKTYQVTELNETVALKWNSTLNLTSYSRFINSVGGYGWGYVGGYYFAAGPDSERNVGDIIVRKGDWEDTWMGSDAMEKGYKYLFHNGNGIIEYQGKGLDEDGELAWLYVGFGVPGAVVAPNNPTILEGQTVSFNVNVGARCNNFDKLLEWLVDKNPVIGKEFDGLTVTDEDDLSTGMKIDVRGDTAGTYPFVFEMDGENDSTYWVFARITVLPDSDRDGVTDTEDDFSNDTAASVDSDGDNHPDYWNSGKDAQDSTTGLTLDKFKDDNSEWADSDGDLIGDNSDDFPNDIRFKYDSDSDGVPDSIEGTEPVTLPDGVTVVSNPSQASNVVRFVFTEEAAAMLSSHTGLNLPEVGTEIIIACDSDFTLRVGQDGLLGYMPLFGETEDGEYIYQWGFFNLEMTVPSGDTEKIYIRYGSDLELNEVWRWLDNNETYLNSTSVTELNEGWTGIQLTDNGTGDKDGVENGIVKIFGGLAKPNLPTAVIQPIDQEHGDRYIWLNGSSSTAGSGRRIINYLWEQTSGENIDFVSANNFAVQAMLPNVSSQTECSVRLTVTDDLGQSNSATETFTILPSNVEPSILSTPPSEDSAEYGVPWQYQVLVEDPDDEELDYLLLNAPAGMDIDENGLITWTPTDTGDFVISVWVADGGENGAAAVMQEFSLSVKISDVYTDTTSPSVSITSPTTSSSFATSSSSISISGSASDNVGITKVDWSNSRTGSSGTCSGTKSWSQSGISLSSGTNMVTVKAYDAAGNTDTDTLTVTYASPAILNSVTISGGPEIIEGNTAQYTCTAQYSDGTSKAVTSSASWGVSSSSYATISSSGLLTGKAVSSDQAVTITVSYGGMSDTFSVMIKAAANVTPYKPTSWGDKIVVSNITGTSIDTVPLLTTDTLYVDWAVINYGDLDIDTTFYNDLYVDGVKKKRWSEISQQVGSYGYVKDFSIGSLSPGLHEIKIVADATEVVSESDELDNTYTKTIRVQGENSLPWLSMLLFEESTPVKSIKTVVSTTGKVWMDRNLGASRGATSSNDSNAYGDLYQWGRGSDGHEKRDSGTTSTLSDKDVPDHQNFIATSGYPYDWIKPQNTNLWQGVTGVNNPCPAGFRLPTKTELIAEKAAWSSDDSFGAYASPLKFVAAGVRSRTDGVIRNEGTGGYYWSSTVGGIASWRLRFTSDEAVMGSVYRTNGFSIRCIQD